MESKMDDKKGHIPFKYPEIGLRVKCLVTKSSFAYAILKIVEADNIEMLVDYKAIIKGSAIGEEVYMCDKVKTGTIIDCIVVSYGENTIFVSQI